MKILLITGSFPPMRCGVADYTSQLARALSRKPGLRVAVLTSRAAASYESSGDFDFFPIVEEWAWREVTKIFKVIRSWAPDLVHIQYPTIGYGDKRLPWLLPLCLRLAGIPVVQTWHEFLGAGLLFRYVSQAVVPGGLIVDREGELKPPDARRRWLYLNKTVRFIPVASSVPSVKLTGAEREAVRAKYARPNAHMIVYFGFIYPRKRVELLFQVSDANNSHLVIIGDSFSEADLRFVPAAFRAASAIYHQSLRQLAETEAWKGKVTMAGFIPAHEAAPVIAAADAVILPYLGGVRGSDTTLCAAQAQGTFVLTTSQQSRGYDPEENTYFASEHDLEEMRRALKLYVGRRTQRGNVPARAWQSISDSHVELYQMQASTKRDA